MHKLNVVSLQSDILGVSIINSLLKNYSCLLGSTVNGSDSSSLHQDEQDAQTEESVNLRSCVPGVLVYH